MNVVGFHAIAEYLRTGAGELEISRENKRIAELVGLCARQGVPVRRVSKARLDGLHPDHRGAVLTGVPDPALRGETLEFALDRVPNDRGLVLVLDGITDPHNLGAIIRTADLFGADAVILPNRRSAREDRTVASVSSGATAYVRMFTVPNLVRAVETLKTHGFWVYGADAKGTVSEQARFRGRVALVMGSEGRGLGRLIRESCDGLVRIPTEGHLESLNVSVAAGILMYEVRRQQSRGA